MWLPVVETEILQGPAAEIFSGEVVAECDVTDVAKKAAARRILMRAVGIEFIHKQV